MTEGCHTSQCCTPRYPYEIVAMSRNLSMPIVEKRLACLRLKLALVPGALTTLVALRWLFDIFLSS